MGIDLETLFQKEAFQHISPEQKKAFQALAGQLEGKGPMEAVGVVLEFSRKMPKENAMTRQEQLAMAEAVMEALPAEDRQKFQTVMKLMETMN